MNPGESIQDAINASCPRDTIYVHAGTYDENVDVDKQITLIGDGADVLTVRGVDVGDHVFEVTADYVDISGFTVTGATGYGEAGIYLYNADHCNISDNTVSKNYWYGIHLSSSSNNTLTSNTVSNNDYGIGMYSSSNIVYHNTLITNTNYNAYDTGTNQWDSRSVGNYYSDYTGTDSNRDGIGDDPYDIPGSTSIDRYPLTGIRGFPLK